MQQRLAGQKITKGALYLLLATVGASLVYALSPSAVQAQIGPLVAASDVGVWSDFHLWTLLSTILIPLQPDGTLDFVGLIFAGLMLYFFLPALENWWGTKRFLFFALWTTLAGSLCGTLVGLFIAGPDLVTGIDPIVFGGIAAFGVLYANHPLRLFGAVELTGKQMAIGMSVFVLAFVLIGQRWAEGASMVAGMAMALAMVSGKFRPKLVYLKWKQRRIRKKLKIVDGDSKKKWVN